VYTTKDEREEDPFDSEGLCGEGSIILLHALMGTPKPPNNVCEMCFRKTRSNRIDGLEKFP